MAATGGLAAPGGIFLMSDSIAADPGSQPSASKNERQPVLFLGHGSPMNAIEDNEYRRSWQA